MDGTWGGRIVRVGMLVALAGCQTAERVEADRSDRLSAFKGCTMADFSGETGLTPSNFYPITGGRMYVVDGPPVVTSYGGYSSVSVCRLLIQTEPNGPTGTADAWTIVGTTRTGSCHVLPIGGDVPHRRRVGCGRKKRRTWRPLSSCGFALGRQASHRRRCA
jgi:hypothetical protein